MGRQSRVTRDKLKLMIMDEAEGPKPLPFRLLVDITDNFSDKQKIGTGGSAVVYKGDLGNSTVAVKKLSIPHKHEKEFIREIQCLEKVKHKNVIRCLGYCYSAEGYVTKYQGKIVMADEQERLICFPYLAKGSLDKYITDASSGLEWSQRYQIINGICQGLHRLHQGDIFHLDLKPENILLDDDMVPKIADFGLSRCLDENQSKLIHTNSRDGTLGYRAPEYINSGVITNKNDLYSLGVIIMKILIGNNDDQFYVVDEFKVLESWMKRLGKLLTSAQLDQIKECARIGIECINDNPNERPPDIKDIIDRLEKTETQNSLKILHVQPTILMFDYLEEPGRLVPCSLQLTNDTDEHMVFMLTTTDSVGWSEPFNNRYGIVTARSTYTLVLTVLEEVPDKRFCDMILQSCATGHDHIWKFSNKHECDKFFEGKKTENAVNEVKLTAFLSQQEGQSMLSKCLHYNGTMYGQRVKILSIEGQQPTLLSMDAHPTKPWIITGHAFGHVRIRNHETQRLLDSFKVSQGPVSSVKFIARKQWFISSSGEGVIHVYSYEPETQKIVSFKAHAAGPISLAVHPTQPYLLSSSPCSGSHEKKLWDWDKEWQCTRTFETEYFARDFFICQISFDPKETNQFACASNDTVKVWSLDSPKPNYHLPGQFEQVNFLEFFTRDDKQYLIIIGSNDTAAKIWDMQKKEYVPNKKMQTLLSPVPSIFSHPDPPTLFSGSYYGTSRFWSTKDFRLEGVFDYGYGGHVWGIACLMGPNKRFVIGQEAALVILDIDNVKDQEDSRDYREPRLCADTRPESTSPEVIKQGLSELLHVHPLTLDFHFQTYKLIPCSLHLRNTTDKDVAFMLSAEEEVESRLHPFTRLPLSGIVSSKSTYTLVLTTRKLPHLPLEQNFKLILQSSISGDRYIDTFAYQSECDQFFRDAKGTGNAVHKVKLEAVFSFQRQTASEVIKQGPSELLHVHPLTLHFHFQAYKLIPCSLHLTNTTDKDVAFMLSAEKEVDSCLHLFTRLPISGIVPSKSTYTLVLTMRKLPHLPLELKINLILQSSISGDRYIYTFAYQSECDQFFRDAKETGNAVHKVKLEAVFTLQRQTVSEEKGPDKRKIWKGFNIVEGTPNIPDLQNGSSAHDSIRPLINIWVQHSGKDFSSTLSSLDADPAESWIITGHSHGDVSMWKHGTQRMMSSINTFGEIGFFQSFHGTQRLEVYSVKFITRKRWFLAATSDGFIHVYKYETRMDFIKRFKAHSYGKEHSSNNIYSSRALVVHPTRPYVLMTFETMKLWDWDKDWKCIRTFVREGSDSICQAAFSPKDPNTFASASSDHTVKLWSLNSSKSLNTLRGHSNQVNCLGFFTRGGQEYLISGSNDSTAKIWDMQEKKCVHTINVFKSPVVSVISLPDTYIATGSEDGTVHLWSSASYRLERILSVGLGFPVRSLCLMGPTRVVIEQYEVSIMEIDTISEEMSLLAGLDDQLIQVEPPELRFPDVHEVSSTLKIRNTTDHHVAFSIWSLNHTADYEAVPNKQVLSPHSTLQIVVTRVAHEWVPADLTLEVVIVKGTIVAEGSDVSYDMFDETKTGRAVQLVEVNVVFLASELISKIRLPWTLDVHPTKPWIMMTQGDYHVRIWNYETRKAKPIAIKGREVTSAKFIARKHWIIAGCSSGLVYVYGYEPEKKNPVKKVLVLRGHSKAVNSLAVHATDPYVLSASKDGKILIWDYENEWKLMKTFHAKSPVEHVVFNPKDTNMFASAQHKTVKIWDLLHSDGYKFELTGHSDLVLCLDYFSLSDKTYLITGSQDKTAKIWDCELQSCVQTLKGHTDIVNVVCCHPDLLLLITGSCDGSVRLWDLDHSTTFRHELKFDFGEVYAIASLKRSTRIAIGSEIGFALVDIDLEGKQKDGDVKSTVVIMDSTNGIASDRNIYSTKERPPLLEEDVPPVPATDAPVVGEAAAGAEQQQHEKSLPRRRRVRRNKRTTMVTSARKP